MKLTIKNLQSALVAWSFIVPLQCVIAQGTLQWTVTFDGPHPIPPTASIGVTNYSEQGMRFTTITPNGQFGRSGGEEANDAFPRNGSAFVYGAFGETLAVTSLVGQPFGLVSVDLAEFSTLYQEPLSVQFVGYKHDGSSVLTEFITDGIIDGAGPLKDFQTFYFGSQFADVVRVEVPTYRWSLDNMVFSNVIPEPGTWALLVLGGVLVGWRLLKRSCRR